MKSRLSSRISDPPEVFIENQCRSYRSTEDIELAASKEEFSFFVSGVGEATLVGTSIAIGVDVIVGGGDGSDFAE